MNSDFRFDFLCVGFNKSGTTSLDIILRESPHIYLPVDKKEILFYAWRQNYIDPVARLQEKYFPDYPCEGKLTGSIEPAYCRHAANIIRDFGPDVKLIFMMRNPINAVYSYFKMYMRRIRGPYYWKLYSLHHNNIQDMFGDFIRKKVIANPKLDFFYSYYLEQYLQYYQPGQMHFIIFEDFIRNQQHETDRLTDFLGTDRIVLDGDYMSNEGSRISRNALCARISYGLYQKSNSARHLGSNEEARLRMLNAVMAPVLYRECKEPMSERNREKLRQIFSGDISRTAEILGREDLKELWR